MKPKLRLAELDPTFFVYRLDPEDDATYLTPVNAIADAVGVQFDCPCGDGHRLLIPFKGRMPDGKGWAVTGTNFDNLTLQPSVDAKCWHGWVRNGEIT